MKPTKILAVVVLALSFFVSPIFAQNNWPNGASTPEQINRNYESARRILGNDFITPEEIAKARRLSYTKDQLDYLMKTMPSEEALRWYKANGYALVAGPPSPMGLLEVRSLNPDLFYQKTGAWYERHTFSISDKAETEWLVIRKEPVPKSTFKSWEEQLRLLSQEESVPNVSDLAWFITTFYKVRGVRLFEKTFVRTSSLTSVGYRVNVGFFYGHGLDVYYYSDDFRHNLIGLAASRKF